MGKSFEIQVEFYLVSMAYSPEVNNFTHLGIDSVRGADGLRTHIAIIFFPGARDRYQTLGYGTFSGPGPGQRNRLWLDRSDFESFYAILRSERPVFLRGGTSDDGTVDFLELYSGREPVGEVDTSLPPPAVTGDLSEELRRRLTAGV